MRRTRQGSRPKIFAISMHPRYELPIEALKDHGWWLTSCDIEIIACFHVLKLWHLNLPPSTWPLCISQLDTSTWYSIYHPGVVYNVVWQGMMIASTNHVVKSDLVNYDHHSYLEDHRKRHLSHVSCHALLWRIYESGGIHRFGRRLDKFGDLLRRRRILSVGLIQPSLFLLNNP
jgi:hypothetical protein